MLTLGYDTATPWGTMALVEDEQTIFEVSLKANKGSGEYLLALLQKLLQRVGQKIDNLDLIAVGTGPGSYTGIRIGLAAAQGLAEGSRKTTHGISTLRIIAENARYASSEMIAAVMDARRNNIYAALYQNHNGTFTEIEAPLFLPAADFALKMADYPSVMMCGDGSKSYQAIWNRYANLIIAPVDWDRPLGSAAARIAHDNQELKTATGTDTEPLVPCYLRKVEAEIRLEEGFHATQNRSHVYGRP